MFNKVFERLNERAKELNCIYNVEELLRNENESLSFIFRQFLRIIPIAWQYSTICEVKITYQDNVYKTEDFKETEWILTSDIVVDNKVRGNIIVCYTQFIRLINKSQFLPEEQQLLNIITDRLNNYIFHRELKETLDFLKNNNNSEPVIDKQMLLAQPDEHWKWRLKIAEKIVALMDFNKFGVKNVYVIGSVKNADSGPGSDIDLLIHFIGDETQKKFLLYWFEGWSLCLSEMNYNKTGYQTDGLLDIHIITNEDIKNKNSFAVMIDSLSNSARKLR